MKIGLVGAGSVGATIAYACQIRGVAQTIAIYDIDPKKTRAEVLDLNHGLQFTPVASVIGSDDIEVLRDSDVIVTTAGAKQRPGQTRMDLAATNVAMMQSLMKQCMSVAPDALHLVVTNPCDVVTYAALKASGLPPSRVFGSGTVLDSSRFRYLLAQHAGVAVQNVHGYVLGEHGDSEIAIWSRANIGMVPIDEYVGASGVALDETGKREIFDQVVNAAYEIIEGKGATWYAVGLAVTRIVEAVLHDESRVLPVSTYLEDYKGISDVCLSVPCVVNRNGVERILDVPMSDAELGGLRASADQVRGVARALGL
ncbi:L-lactate dehydrogenase [Nocardioides sp. WL0053]|uniref:L-lactate dehydrogenase n=1 Tax=Nocardioides jiangsuensis TaxID=2866161 RepID=A0ABS7RIY6_9ACTN|nr:L-lactate dehydrogenase [Nocardioides jiangsuensis]MBY9075018.1 L-lactate dehydrogenase [Nocardioides jiangsuensis]